MTSFKICKDKCKHGEERELSFNSILPNNSTFAI